MTTETSNSCAVYIPTVAPELDISLAVGRLARSLLNTQVDTQLPHLVVFEKLECDLHLDVWTSSHILLLTVSNHHPF
jgi:hypothetical protein